MKKTLDTYEGIIDKLKNKLNDWKERYDILSDAKYALEDEIATYQKHLEALEKKYVSAMNPRKCIAQRELKFYVLCLIKFITCSPK